MRGVGGNRRRLGASAVSLTACKPVAGAVISDEVVAPVAQPIDPGGVICERDKHRSRPAVDGNEDACLRAREPNPL